MLEEQAYSIYKVLSNYIKALLCSQLTLCEHGFNNNFKELCMKPLSVFMLEYQEQYLNTVPSNGTEKIAKKNMKSYTNTLCCLNTKNNI